MVGNSRTDLKGCQMKLFRNIYWVLIPVLILSACQPGANSPTDADTRINGDSDLTDQADDLLQNTTSGEFADENLCSRGFNLDFVDLNAAAQTPTLNPDFSTGTLGLVGAETLVASFFTPEDTFCGAALPGETQEMLTQIDKLIEDGNVDEARQQLEDLLRDYPPQAGTNGSLGVLASVVRILDKEQTYRFVKTFLISAARFQVLGMEDLANEALDEARDTFSEWAEAAIESTSDIKELLSIAAQYQLLGDMEGLDQDAIERAADLAEKKVLDLLRNFNPCEANQDQITEILQALAMSQALSGYDQGSTEIVLEALETVRKNNKAKAEGKSIPECEGAWVVELDGNYGGFEVDFSVRSCDGIHWKGEHTHKGSMLGGASVIDLAAMFDFTVPDAGSSTTIRSDIVNYDSTGPWLVTAEGDSGQATVSNNFSFSMELDRLAGKAVIDLVSNGGEINIEGQSMPFPQLFGPGEDVPASVSINEACPN